MPTLEELMGNKSPSQNARKKTKVKTAEVAKATTTAMTTEDAKATTTAVVKPTTTADVMPSDCVTLGPSKDGVVVVGPRGFRKIFKTVEEAKAWLRQ